MARNEPTIGSILQELAGQFDGIVHEREVFDKVLARRPSKAKNPHHSIREQLRFEGTRLGWVWLGEGELAPLHAVLAGLRFRVVPSADELAAGAISQDSLRPFVTLDRDEVELQDAKGRPIPLKLGTFPTNLGLFGTVDAVAIELGDWPRRERFAAGDSLLITIERASPLTLRLEREPAGHFDRDAVAAQDRELIEEIVARVRRSSRKMLFVDQCLLPVYARASWRTAYPGRPWQDLVAADTRLRFLDNIYITDASVRRPIDWLFGEEADEEALAESEAALLSQITELQAELLASRRGDAAQGLWNGLAPRASTARVIFDMRQGTAETIYPGAVNALQDHTADIEEHIANGDYEDDGWTLDDDTEAMFDDDDLDDLDEIDDIDAFVEQNPGLGEAARRLMESLTPEEIERLQAAETIEDAQSVLASRLTELLRSEPSLFAPIELPRDIGEQSNGRHANGNGHANGHGASEPREGGTFDIEEFEEAEWEADDGLFEDDWDDDDLDLGDEEANALIEQALERSSGLLESFYQHQLASGKSETTATNRTRDVWLYADFLGNYYQRSLEGGDYSTLDECLFFFYPRKVLNGSARAVREVCTSTKQFYAFLKAEQKVADDAFAVAMWKRRDQAAQVVDLYAQIDSESPQFERLFAHLFAPYTA